MRKLRTAEVEPAKGRSVKAVCSPLCPWWKTGQSPSRVYPFAKSWVKLIQPIRDLKVSAKETPRNPMINKAVVPTIFRFTMILLGTIPRPGQFGHS